MVKTNPKIERATFGAGCFWGVEELFRTTAGVISTAVGYMGGHTDKPTYEAICSDETGHAEVVQVTFDPAEISYDTLLNLFWENHNPTTRNRQGPDEGSQYRSVVFYHTQLQQQTALAAKQALTLSEKWGGREIVTEILPALTFNRAEEYHQQYLKKRGKTNCHF